MRIRSSEPGSIQSARPMISSADDTPGTETRRPRSEVAGARRCPPVEATAANRCFAGRFRAATATLWTHARVGLPWPRPLPPSVTSRSRLPGGKISSALGGQWARVSVAPSPAAAAASYRPPHRSLTILGVHTCSCNLVHCSCRLLRNKTG